MQSDESGHSDPIEDLLSEGNYISAYLRIKSGEFDRNSRNDLTGRLVLSLVDDLSATKGKERVIYLRALLAWVFNDIPGLSAAYREQVRTASSGSTTPVEDLLKTFGALSSFASGRREGDVRDTFENIRDQAEDASGSGEFESRLKDFVSHAGSGVEEGLKRASDFFDSLSKMNKKPDEQEDQPEDGE